MIIFLSFLLTALRGYITVRRRGLHNWKNILKTRAWCGYIPLLWSCVLKKYTANGKFLKAPVNLVAIPAVSPNRSSQKLKLVFSTSRTISDDLSRIFVKDMIRVINEFGNTIEIHFWGFVPEELKNLPQVKFHRFMPNYQKYMRKIYEQGYDIGLAPMKNDIFP